VERCLRRGRGAEQAAAAQLAILLSVQLGCTEDAEQLCRELMAPLSFVARDSSVTPAARAKVSSFMLAARSESQKSLGKFNWSGNWEIAEKYEKLKRC